MLNVVLLYTATPARIFFLQKLLPWLECGNICLIRLVLSFAIIFMAFRFVKRILWTFCKFCSPAIYLLNFLSGFAIKTPAALPKIASGMPFVSTEAPKTPKSRAWLVPIAWEYWKPKQK